MVTGGTRGLGLAISRCLAEAGYEVIAVARRETAEIAALASEPHRPDWGCIRFRSCDLSDLAGLQSFVRDISAEFPVLYGLVNNAGVGSSGILTTMSDAQITQLISMNIVSPILLTKYIVRSMMAHGGSRIVNLSSIVAENGFKGLSVYSATKAAITGFTRSLARELGPLGITVNAVAPGFIDTEMTRELGASQRAQIVRRSALQRPPEPDDVGAAVAFLMSDAARNITGVTLTVDAGNSA